jgi:hypothetical protein
LNCCDLDNLHGEADHVMVRVFVDADELRVKKPASIHQRCQVNSHVLRDIAQEKVAKQLHSDCVGVVGVARFAA